MSEELISLDEARSKGLRHYFTGLPCNHGHLSPRYVKGTGCVRCAIDNGRKWALKNPEKMRACGKKHDDKRTVVDYEHVRAINRRATLTYRLKRFGLTHEQYKLMFEQQQNRCKICDEEFVKTPDVDHCHSTGKIRGLLCTQCNHLLGNARDNVETLSRAIIYLKGVLR